MAEDDVFLQIEDVFRRIMKKVPGEWRKHAKAGLSRSQAMVLYQLGVESPQRSSSLACSLSITTGGLTGITDKLVKEDLVQRNRDDDDRRVVYLAVTEKGRDVLSSMEATRKAFMATFFRGLSQEELDQFDKIAHKILANFEDADEQTK